MAAPVVEQITQAIVSRLQTIIVSSGYEEAITAVNRPGAPYADNAEALKDYSVTVYQADSFPIVEIQRALGPDRSGQPPFEAKLQSYVLLAAVDNAGQLSTIDARLNQLCADVEKCLNTARRSWLGSLTKHWKEDSEKIWTCGFNGHDEGELSQFITRAMTFQVPYMTVYGDPYTLPDV